MRSESPCLAAACSGVQPVLSTLAPAADDFVQVSYFPAVPACFLGERKTNSLAGKSSSEPSSFDRTARLRLWRFFALSPPSCREGITPLMRKCLASGWSRTGLYSFKTITAGKSFTNVHSPP